uniref:Uroporphyrinogen decarboxylase n=1 Tax=Strigamia maritima TaxID=126957 RepID=T1JKF0_STRMM
MKEFPLLKNDLILRAARGEKVERVPVWLMRQAGRYLPEFQEVRKEYDFFTICQTPELACKVTMQPLNRFDLDAAIIFSDILVIPQALGMEVEMKPTIGPFFPSPLQSPADISRLETPVNVQNKLNYVFEAISLTRLKLEGKVPLIGFSGAPWTLMAYMIEGAGSKTYSKSKKWLYSHVEDSHRLLQILTDTIVDYLVGQVAAGAQLLQVFESHAEHLGPESFREFCIPYLKQIRNRVVSELKSKDISPVPMIMFAKGGNYALKDLSELGFDVISLDWTIEPSKAREITGSELTLQGNLDPCALYGNKDLIERNAYKMLRDFGTHRYIANLGHGLYPDINPENVQYFIHAVHEISQKMVKEDSNK